MAENSKIEWTHHTFNPWIGCQKVGPGCDHCYAEAMMDTRLGRVQWGPHAARSRTSPSYWRKPMVWDAAAKSAGQRHRVFCASLADVFDNHASILPEWRDDLWALIAATPHLDWMLLTKRPGNIANMLPVPFDFEKQYPNVWLGCTVVNQAEADRDIPKLLAVPAAVRFLSMEPLLGPVDLRRWTASANVTCKACKHFFWLHDADPCDHAESGAWTLACPNCGDCRCKPAWTPADARHLQMEPPADWLDRSVGRFDRVHPTIALSSMIDLVIVGGESGPGARPMHPDWARSLRDQCVAAGVPFFFKQWGEWVPLCALGETAADALYRVQSPEAAAREAPRKCLHDSICLSPDGSTFSLGQAGQVHKIEEGAFSDHRSMSMYRVGKKAAGRLLDGRTWDQMPGVGT